MCIRDREVINKHFPDWRRVLNELQRYSANGAIDSGILGNLQETSIKGLIDFIKDKNYTEMRKWVKMNIDIDQTTLFRKFYDSGKEFMTNDSIPALIMILSKYQYQAAFAADAEINIMAFLTEVMIDCEML